MLRNNQETSSRQAHQTQPRKVQTTKENIPKVSIGTGGSAVLAKRNQQESCRGGDEMRKKLSGWKWMETRDVEEARGEYTSIFHNFYIFTAKKSRITARYTSRFIAGNQRIRNFTGQIQRHA